LNSDPTTDGSYTSLDYAIEVTPGGSVYAHTQGTGDTLIGTCVAGDLLAVTNDRSTVRWLKNGTVLASAAATGTSPLYFDSSLYSVGVTLTNIRFGPLSDVSAGVAANAAINDPTTGLAQRLSANSRNVLTGGAALVVGSLVTDGSGARVSGDGVGITSKGIALYGTGGTPVIVIDAVTKSVSVAGDISGSTGTFSAVTIGSSCSFGQTAYDTGNGGWIQGGATPKFSMRSASGKYVRIDVAAGVFDFNSVNLNTPTLVNPVITGFTVNPGSNISSSGGGTSRSLGTRTASISGGTAPYSYLWSDNDTSGGDVTLTNATTATVGISVSGATNPGEIRSSISCTVTDASGLVKVGYFDIDVIFF
jgi:hypothetical protein